MSTFVVNWFRYQDNKSGLLGIADATDRIQAEDKFREWYPNHEVISVFEDPSWGDYLDEDPDPSADPPADPTASEPPPKKKAGWFKSLADLVQPESIPVDLKVEPEPGDCDEEYLIRLQRHDWYYSYSDDVRVWRQGDEERKRLVADARGNAARLAAFERFKPSVG
jgi:hypothetical protein